MVDVIPLQISDDFKRSYYDLFYELSKEAFNAAKNDSGLGRYMTQKQCCEYIGISFGYLQKLEHMGLPVIELDGKTLVDREDVIQFLNQYKTVSGM